tara:strand:- start:1321 stop:3510 length:2190 start_codon:yes stop_codon:yes gene_type:complete
MRAAPEVYPGVLAEVFDDIDSELPPFHIRVVKCVPRVGGKVQCIISDGEQTTKLCVLHTAIAEDNSVRSVQRRTIAPDHHTHHSHTTPALSVHPPFPKQQWPSDDSIVHVTRHAIATSRGRQGQTVTIIVIIAFDAAATTAAPEARSSSMAPPPPTQRPAALAPPPQPQPQLRADARAASFARVAAPRRSAPVPRAASRAARYPPLPLPWPPQRQPPPPQQHPSTQRNPWTSAASASTARAAKRTWPFRGRDVDALDFCNEAIFGHTSFRGKQREVIEAVESGRDVFVLMPTGGGKSLCYQLPACTHRGLTIVISPLISLIEDQVRSLIEKGIPASSLGAKSREKKTKKSSSSSAAASSSSSSSDVAAVNSAIYGILNRAVRDGRSGDPRASCLLKLLYVTPENITINGVLQDILRGLQDVGLLARFVIDEAHCVSQWGHDFRPAYVDLKSLRRMFTSTPIIALTATASKRVVQDVSKVLGLQRPVISQTSFNRINLEYSVVQKMAKKALAMDQLVEVLKPHRGTTGIVYCLSKAECQEVAEHLRRQTPAINATHYHAGLSTTLRTAVQRAWQGGRIEIVVATIAYGMGIDKSDVRFVVHFVLPKSIENYYQETGRAGRDGENSKCVLMFSKTDNGRMKNLLQGNGGRGKRPGAAKKKKRLDTLAKVVAYAQEEKLCRRSILLDFFGEKNDFARKGCNGMCDNCRPSARSSSSSSARPKPRPKKRARAV